MSTDNTQFTLGEHNARLDAQDAQLASIRATVDGLGGKIDTLLARGERVRGGFKLLVLVGSAAAGASTFMHEVVLPWIHGPR